MKKLVLFLLLIGGLSFAASTTCNSCATCQAAFDNVSITEINLSSDITFSGDCLALNANASNTTFLGKGYYMNATSGGGGVQHFTIQDGVENVTIRDVLFYGDGYEIFGVSGTSSNINIINTTTTEGGPDADAPKRLIYASSGTLNNYTFQDNVITSIGFINIGSGTSATTNMVIYNNTVYTDYTCAGQIGLDSGSDTNANVAYNKIYGQDLAGSCLDSGGVIEYGTGADDGTAYSNEVYNMSSFSGILVYGDNNLVYDNYFHNVSNPDIGGSGNLFNTTLNCIRQNILGGNCTGGNYWDGNYNGVDLDGDYVGDTHLPYTTGLMSDYLALTTQGPSPPTHTQPILNSTYGWNFTFENLTAYNQTTFDPQDLDVKNIFDWRLNGNSIALWNMPMEGGALAEGNTTVKDYSLNRINGTIEDSSWVPGVSGNSLEFDGTNDYVTFGDTSTLGFVHGTMNFTYSIWVQHNNYAEAAYRDVLGTSHSGGHHGGRLYYHYSYDTFVYSHARNYYPVEYIRGDSFSISDNNYHHLVVRGEEFNSTHGNITMYIDGVQQNDSKILQKSIYNISTYAPVLGVTPNYVNFWNGDMDDLQIYNCTLNLTEILNLNNTPGYVSTCQDGSNGLAVHFALNESEKSRAEDSSGNGHHGTLHGYGRPFYNETGGYDGFGAYEFDGLGARITTTDGIWDGETQITLSAWVKLGTMPYDGSPTVRTIVKNNGGAAIGMYFQENTHQLQCIFRNASIVSSGTAIGIDDEVDTDWHMWTCTNDINGDGLTRLYKDGVLVNTATISIGGSFQQFNVHIGGGGDGRDFNGTIDDVLILNRSLTQEQIQELYNNRTDFIRSGLTAVGDVWQTCITPNNAWLEGAENCTNNLTIIDYDPIDVIANTTGGQYETEENNVSITINASYGEMITDYQLTAYYNNTLVLNTNGSGLNTSTLNIDAPVYAPLVEVNGTNITFEVYLNVTTNSPFYPTPTNYTDNATGNDTVLLWYVINSYPITKLYNYTVEHENTINISLPGKPPLAPSDISILNNPYSLTNCTKIYANGSTSSISCGSGLLNFVTHSEIRILPSHLQEDGVIAMEYGLDRNYSLFYNASVESTSSKIINDSDSNVSKDYFVWIVNESNGSINGTSNISKIFYVTFYDEESLAPLNIDSVAATYVVDFPDGNSKTYYIAYATNVSNSTIRAFPDWHNVSLDSVEVYSKTSYTTRSRFLVNSFTELGNLTNISVYFLPLSNASYAIMNVVDQGDAVPGAYIQILKYYAATNLYLNIDQKITNSDGKAAAYLDVDAYYKFAVYDDAGTLLYLSTQPEQFILNSGVYEITIDISDQQAVDLTGPYISSLCYGNNSTNSIIFTYADVTGKTDQVRFLAYRANVSTPVCNSTTNGSSGSWVCALPPGENLSSYLYTCKVDYATSPFRTNYVGLIDFRIFNAVFDWQLVALVVIVTLAAAAVHIGIGVGLASVSLFALSALEIIKINEAVSIPILVAGLVLSYLLLRRD